MACCLQIYPDLRHTSVPLAQKLSSAGHPLEPSLYSAHILGVYAMVTLRLRLLVRMVSTVVLYPTSSPQGGLLSIERIITMIEHLINSVAHAFELVVGLAGSFLGTEEGGVFGAIAELSSNVF